MATYLQLSKALNEKKGGVLMSSIAKKFTITKIQQIQKLHVVLLGSWGTSLRQGLTGSFPVHGVHHSGKVSWVFKNSRSSWWHALGCSKGIICILQTLYISRELGYSLGLHSLGPKIGNIKVYPLMIATSTIFPKF